MNNPLLYPNTDREEGTDIFHIPSNIWPYGGVSSENMENYQQIQQQQNMQHIDENNQFKALDNIC